MNEDSEVDFVSFDPETLAQLQGVLQAYPDIARLVGGLHTFRVVIDANKVFRDLLARYRSWSQPTLTECLVRSGVLEVYIPIHGVNEVNSDALQRFARNQAPAEKLRAEWAAYQECLIIDDRFDQAVPGHPVIEDPKDVPYFQLMEAIGAIGILTEDKHFNRIGLKKMSGDSLGPVKAYAAIMQELLGVRIAVSGVGIVSIAGLVEGGKIIARVWSQTPDLVKLLFGGLAIYAIMDPRMQSRAKAASVKLWKSVEPAMEFAADQIAKDNVRMQLATEERRKLLHGRATHNDEPDE
ncbi:hypothetical protein [Hyphomonas beringensis]|uniref:hypothetical protein n=1 Tax=Hyphomonas beringensis TaxID=1280946 RepID=UPI00138E43EA|nr:hypothetical protein [Hyphomonas beringensis]